MINIFLHYLKDPKLCGILVYIFLIMGNAGFLIISRRSWGGGRVQILGFRTT